MNIQIACTLSWILLHADFIQKGLWHFQSILTVSALWIVNMSESKKRQKEKIWKENYYFLLSLISKSIWKTNLIETVDRPPLGGEVKQITVCIYFQFGLCINFLGKYVYHSRFLSCYIPTPNVFTTITALHFRLNTICITTHTICALFIYNSCNYK